jgi:hypothetical protein
VLWQKTLSGSAITKTFSCWVRLAWARVLCFGSGPKSLSRQPLALYLRAAALLRELALARADGSLRNFLARLGRIDVLVIDDWAMAPLNENERREVWEIREDRYQTRSTVLTSQLLVSRWHEQIGDPTIADGILDRLVHNAHRIEMRGESMRKNAIRHRTRRKNEPKPVSVRCLSYGTNFPEPDSGQLPEPASGVGRCSTADESHAEPHAPITAGLPVIRPEQRRFARMAVSGKPRAEDMKTTGCFTAHLS